MSGGVAAVQGPPLGAPPSLSWMRAAIRARPNADPEFHSYWQLGLRPRRAVTFYRCDFSKCVALERHDV